MSFSEVYRHPEYYDLGYRWNTEVECNFIESCLEAHAPKGSKRLFDIGCGSGRHLLPLAKAGFQITGVDVRPEMVAYVQEQAKQKGLSVTVEKGDINQLTQTGPFDLAYCFMDTFRFLLTNEAIINHLRTVASLLAPGGVYVTDFWIPRQMDQIGNEVHQWEQSEGDTTVRVFYLQHPETVDPITQTFEDELVFEIQKGGETQQEIRGGPTRTRLILPQEFRALVEASGVFDIVSTHSEFDIDKPLDLATISWRMITVLRKRVPPDGK